MLEETRIPNESGMEAYAATLVTTLARGTSAYTLALSGELGAGKTTFVKALAKALGVSEHITSPTFVILKTYPLEGQVFDRLIHIDAYRLKSADELRVLGWGALLQDPSNIVCIEWPERVEALMPPDAVRLTFSYSEGDTRTIHHGTQEKKHGSE